MNDLKSFEIFQYVLSFRSLIPCFVRHGSASRYEKDLGNSPLSSEIVKNDCHERAEPNLIILALKKDKEIG